MSLTITQIKNTLRTKLGMEPTAEEVDAALLDGYVDDATAAELDEAHREHDFTGALRGLKHSGEA